MVDHIGPHLLWTLCQQHIVNINALWIANTHNIQEYLKAIQLDLLYHLIGESKWKIYFVMIYSPMRQRLVSYPLGHECVF